MKQAASLIFSNKSWLQTILKNTFWVSLSEGVLRLSRAGILVLMARVLGPDDYGSFAFAFATVSLFAFIFDAGIAQTITRDFAKDAENEKVFPEILSLKLCLALAGISVIGAASLLIADDTSLRFLMIVLGLYFVIVDFETGFLSTFRARQKMEYEALIRMFAALGLVSATAIVLWAAPSALNISIVYLGAAFSSLTITYFVRRKIIGDRPGFRFTPGVWAKVLRSSIPIGATAAMGTLYFSLDSTMLGVLGTLRDTGLYNAVSRIAYFLVLPGTVLASVLIPAFSASSSATSQIANRVNLWVVINLALGAIVVAFIWAQSENIVLFLYGDEFIESAEPLRWLSITSLAIYVYYPWYTMLIVYEKQNWLLVGTMFGLLANIVLTLTLIPYFGMTGAAVSTIGTHSAVMLGFGAFTKRSTPVAPINTIWTLSAATSAAAGAAAYLVAGMFESSMWIALPVCLAAFGAVFAAVGRLLGLNARIMALVRNR